MAPVCMIEFTGDDCDDFGKAIPSSIVCRVWGDAMKDDYTLWVICRNMEEFFADEQSGTAITDSLREDEKLCVDTELGQLTAYLGCNPDYPGIYIDVKRGSTEAPVILVEYTETEHTPSGTLPPCIISRIWGDTTNEDYTDAAVSENLDAFFAYSDEDSEKNN